MKAWRTAFKGLSAVRPGTSPTTRATLRQQAHGGYDHVAAAIFIDLYGSGRFERSGRHLLLLVQPGDARAGAGSASRGHRRDERDQRGGTEPALLPVL